LVKSWNTSPRNIRPTIMKPIPANKYPEVERELETIKPLVK
jgi:hypothetical protein